jgi:hypothetical protein
MAQTNASATPVKNRRIIQPPFIQNNLQTYYTVAQPPSAVHVKCSGALRHKKWSRGAKYDITAPDFEPKGS